MPLRHRVSCSDSLCKCHGHRRQQQVAEGSLSHAWNFPLAHIHSVLSWSSELWREMETTVDTWRPSCLPLSTTIPKSEYFPLVLFCCLHVIWVASKFCTLTGHVPRSAVLDKQGTPHQLSSLRQQSVGCWVSTGLTALHIPVLIKTRSRPAQQEELEKLPRIVQRRHLSSGDGSCLREHFQVGRPGRSCGVSTMPVESLQERQFFTQGEENQKPSGRWDAPCSPRVEPWGLGSYLRI